MWFTAWVSGSTRSESRQLVSHKAIEEWPYSGIYPLTRCSLNDVISVREKAKKQLRVQSSLALAEQYGFADWVEMDIKTMKGTFNAPL